MRRSRVFSREERSAPGAIDLTPMLDVVFIMLIFFIVTASFIEEAGIEVDRKVLADLAVFDKPAFAALAVQAKAQLDA